MEISCFDINLDFDLNDIDKFIEHFYNVNFDFYNFYFDIYIIDIDKYDNMVIKFLGKKELIISFEGNDYYFPEGKKVVVNDNVAEFIKDRWTLSFEFDIKPKKGELVERVKTSKTKVYTGTRETPTTDMISNKAPDYETQGSDFYGAGLEVDDLTEK